MSDGTQSSEGARLGGKIKWFNRSKGFGFIVPSDGTGDVFLPLAVLERSGFGDAPDGASVVFEWVQGPKGRAATQVLELDASTAQPRAPREGGGRFRPRDDAYAGGGGGDAGATETLDGVVKWYDPARGFGFILPNDGGKDIFVHVTALRRSGLDGLEPGQPVRMTVAQARRGREASQVTLI
ncbi:MAG TPA: cold shock domain-containing protein [Stellaceae bacterium]|nr:cold shock domain-containing protein [Stellaceae bacterium]